MQAEFDGLVKNHTWVLVSLPKDRKVIKNKWVLRVKKLASSLVDKLKSKVVANGFNQTDGFDFNETFSSIIK